MAHTVHSADGIPIEFEVRGSGSPTLVFVHGWCCDRSYWAAQLDHFSSRARVVAIDLAGHGGSGSGRREWNMPAYGQDVVAVANQLGLEHMVLIGHSMGGDVIVEAALRLGPRVSGLVWVDVYPELGRSPIPPAEFREKTAPFREDFAGAVVPFVASMFPPSADPALVQRVASDMASAPPDVGIGSMEHAWTCEPSICAALETLSAPRVAINPENRPTDIESLARYGFRTLVMPNVGHFLMMEDPATFNRLLGGAIENLTSMTARREDRTV
jgi:pimeloyl-ACP methyl ester carboxylesterase